ncbi:hypothetical protein ROHU_028420 [Labeo rohita]|uniref:Uncharacterized protein n=1 Tax=Labeo rohita TaxID=84645 RepID=A0A498M6N5_LABRO|nr:hypothetical protein ROHU_028420 [Labeo rohita]
MPNHAVTTTFQASAISSSVFLRFSPLLRPGQGEMACSWTPPINKSGSPRPLRFSPSRAKSKLHSSLQGLGQSMHGPQHSLLAVRANHHSFKNRFLVIRPQQKPSASLGHAPNAAVTSHRPPPRSSES